MNILYLGVAAEHSTSLDRAKTLERLGHRVTLLDPGELTPRSRCLVHLHRRTGFRLLQRKARGWLDARVGRGCYDLAWVNAGEFWGPRCVGRIRAAAGAVLNYNNDDPLGPRDGRYWDMYRRSVAEYDLLCVRNRENLSEAAALGAKRLLRIWMSYDTVRHARLELSAEDARQWGNEVVFVGTWMPERGPFMRTLLLRGIPVTVYGDRWQKAREWPQLRRVWKGPGLGGSDYVKAIQYAQVSLGLLSKENRDLHTRRSVEIPYIGGLLCAERTSEHLQMYREGEEAVFWDNAEECADQCRRLLDDEALRRRIALAGRERVLRSGYSNDEVVAQILDEVSRVVPSRASLPQREHGLG